MTTLTLEAALRSLDAVVAISDLARALDWPLDRTRAARRRGLTNISSRVLLASSRGEIDDQWLKRASNADRVALQSLLKQGAVVPKLGTNHIVPAPDIAYGLDPTMSRPPAPLNAEPSLPGGLEDV